jgi:hypothetical protein
VIKSKPLISAEALSWGRGLPFNGRSSLNLSIFFGGVSEKFGEVNLLGILEVENREEPKAEV